jgi:hypothetical protein
MLIEVRLTKRLWAFWPNDVMGALFSIKFGIIVLFPFPFSALLCSLDTADYRDETLSEKGRDVLSSPPRRCAAALTGSIIVSVSAPRPEKPMLNRRIPSMCL